MRCWPKSLAAFNDLLTRTATGVALAAVGLGAIWLGGWWFFALVLVAMGLMVWEIAQLCGVPGPRAIMAGLAAPVSVAILSNFDLYGAVIAVFFLGIAPAILAMNGQRLRLTEEVGLLWVQFVLLAGLIALALRDGGGALWVLWLIVLVAITDICGYFAGRVIGGAKFWPSVSPKKTWSGVVAGWVGAGLVGALFIAPLNMGAGLIPVSVLLSFASQLGDIMESALKRQAGAKDSSALLPGHGGLLDRLDGVIGATLVLGLIAALTNFPRAPI